MRSVIGLFGKTSADGGPDDKSRGRLIPHLNGALAKTATDERLIFIDLNAPWTSATRQPARLVESGSAGIEKYELSELASGQSAYVFVTNFPFHRQLEEVPSLAAVPFGLGMPDFNRTGEVRISEAYRSKQKHIDAYNIGSAMEEYLRFPTTFDGSLPSEAFGRPFLRILIGETYHFESVGDGGTVGTVTSAMVDETKKEMVISISARDGKNQLLRAPMSDEHFAEYLEFRDGYFGRLDRSKSEGLRNEFELFEWLMDVDAKRRTRESLMTHLQSSPELLKQMSQLNDEELRLAYCESLVAATVESSRREKQ